MSKTALLQASYDCTGGVAGYRYCGFRPAGEIIARQVQTTGGERIRCQGYERAYRSNGHGLQQHRAQLTHETYFVTAAGIIGGLARV